MVKFGSAMLTSSWAIYNKGQQPVPDSDSTPLHEELDCSTGSRYCEPMHGEQFLRWCMPLQASGSAGIVETEVASTQPSPVWLKSYYLLLWCVWSAWTIRAREVWLYYKELWTLTQTHGLHSLCSHNDTRGYLNYVMLYFHTTAAIWGGKKA